MASQSKVGLLVRAGSVGILAACCFTASGCGGSHKVENTHTSVSIGQELKDLDEARNKGLLTEDEYNKKREDILKRK